ncbi:MAG: 5-guanidino-2-oxopentanoate decarboxylase [Hyphomicrobiaceae bacterium]
MPTMATGVALAHLLEAHGVRHVFGIPGVHNVEFYRGLWDTKIRHVSPRHEQGAGFMADGYARATGKPGVAMVITGPGLTNIATAMGQAYGDSIPLLVLSSVNQRHELGLGKGYLHEMPNQRNLSAGLTAFSHTLMRPDELPEVLRAAFAVFHSARPRPVHIEIPIDVGVARQDWSIDGVGDLPSRPAADPAALDRLSQRLATASRVVIVCGGGASGAADGIRALAERLEAPVVMTTNARGIVPPDHPLCTDFAVAKDAGRRLVDEADFVLAIGTEFGETDYEFYAVGPFDPKPPMARIDVDPRQIAIGPRLAEAVVADARLAVEGLLARLGTDKGKHDAAWTERTVTRMAEIARTAREPEDPFYDAFLSAIRSTLGDPILVGDSTKIAYRATLTYRGSSPRSFFGAATGFGTLGYALPAGIGAKIANPDRPVVVLTGDGGIQFTLPELMSAREAKAGIIVIVWNNNGYREIRDYMVSKEIKPVAVDIGPPDFAKTAEAAGVGYARPKSLGEFEKVLQKHGAKAEIPLLIETGPWMIS